MNYQELYKSGVDILKAAGIEDAEQDAFYLLSCSAGIDRAKYFLKKQESVEKTAEERYFELIKRRTAHEPCQYITGSTEFMGLEFKVTPAVLIPRQDTETLVEKALGILNAFKKDRPKVLDLCTGSGCIAISVKHFCPRAEVCAVDISEKALETACGNARANSVEIEFIKSDMFGAIAGRKFDIILTNPPYITEDEYEELMPEVRVYEPVLALKAGCDGLDFYRIIASEAPAHLNENGAVLAEIGCGQAEAVTALLEENGFRETEVLKDLAGLDRVVCAEI